MEVSQTNIQQLGFGERVPGSCIEPTISQKIHSTGMLILFNLSTLSFVTLAGTLIGAPIALGLTSAIILGYSAAAGAIAGLLSIAIIALIVAQMKSISTPLDLVEKFNNPDAPKLGTFSNNDILITEHGLESSEWKLEWLRQAKQEILLSGNFCGGKLFRESLNIIRESLSNNSILNVHIISSSMTLEDEDRTMVAEIKKSFPDRFHFLETPVLFEFCPVVRGIENHVKMLVIDDNRFVTGGTSLQDQFGSTVGVNPSNDPKLTPKNSFLMQESRDHDFVGQGPLAKTLAVEFRKLWTVWSYKTSASLTNTFIQVNPDLEIAHSNKWNEAISTGKVNGNVRVKALVSDPDKPNAISAEHKKMIETAKKSIKISNLTFNSSPEIHETLQDAVQRDVDVSLITNGIKHGGHRSFYARNNYPNYLPLMMGRKIDKKETKKSITTDFQNIKRPAKVYEYNVPETMFHKKTAIYDGWVIISGSYNFGLRSHGFYNRGGDYEISLVIESEELGKKAVEMYNFDIKNSAKITLEEAYEYYNNNSAYLQAKFLSPFLV